MAQVSFQDAGGRLYGEMQKCIIYIQNHPDQDITMEDLAGRMAYAPIQLSYLFDLFFEKSLEEWDIEKIRAYQGKGKIPYERVIDKENTEICFVRRREQKIVAESILSETVKSQQASFLEAAMEKVEEHAKDNWRKRTSTEERMLFWWHDSEYRFHFLSGREQSKNEGKERGERETFEVVLEASDYAVFTWKENFTGRAAESMLKMVLKYALCDWETENQIWYDQNKIYFISYENGKYYVYMPLRKRIQENYKIKSIKQERKIYGLNEWIDYIDEHIKEELTAKNLATVFGYSERHFRKEFQDVFGMGPITYITQRKVQFAAKALREGKLPAEVGKEYGFCSRNGFDKAFRRVFYTSPAKYARAGAKVVNLDRYYSEYKDKIKISYIDMDEIKMAGWTIIANRREADIPAQLAFWLDEHSPQCRKLNALTGEEKGRDKIALWYQEKENIEYILGPIVESFDNLPEDAFQVTIAAGRYAVFESDQENDMENLPETVRMFARCVLYGWIREHRDELSLQRLTFERYTSQKMYLYVPVSEKGTGGNERKDEKNFEKQSEK